MQKREFQMFILMLLNKLCIINHKYSYDAQLSI